MRDTVILLTMVRLSVYRLQASVAFIFAAPTTTISRKV
jgi:hypothetical protein